MSELAVQDLAFYQEIAQENHRGLVPMVLLEHAMPHRRGDIAGFRPEDARAMHVAGQGSPYLPDGKAPKSPRVLAKADARKQGADAETERLDAIELETGIFAEDELTRIAKAKEIKGLEPNTQMALDEATSIINAELERRTERDRQEDLRKAGGVTSASVKSRRGA